MRIRSGLLLVLFALAAPAPAQEPPPGRPDAQADAQTGAMPGSPAEDARLDPEALDDLVAPVALYPDALLSQVLMAATYPLEIVKADRFLDDNAALTDKERAEAAEAEDWDQSVRILAGGFPEVIARMAEGLDWTEALGDAMIAQTDDVLDAVQRMRAQAAAAGNLTSNEAQTVETTGDVIAIAPADPGRIYVPAYDPQAVYAAPVETGAGLVAAGAVAFGAALLLDDIFDDDDCCWRGPDRIDWDDREIHVDRDIDVDRDVTRDIDIDRPAWKPTDRQRAAARERIAERGGDIRPGGGPRPEVRDARRAAAADRIEDRGGARRPSAEARARGAANLKGKAPGAQAAVAPHRAKEISRPDRPAAARKAPPRKPETKRSAFHKPPATARPHRDAARRGHASAHHARRR